MVCPQLCGMECVYTFGVAQTIIALAQGTQLVKKVDKITGPVNICGTAAKD